jgi:hypothetical protein
MRVCGVAFVGIAAVIACPSIMAAAAASQASSAKSVPAHTSSTQSSSDQSGSTQSGSAPAILPQQFAGWQMQGGPQTSSNPAVADPTNAAVLREYRFSDFSAATYKSDDGRTLKIRAARFTDASGGFGAYTFYLQREMAKEQIGDQGASLTSEAGQRVLFYRGHILVDALFSQQSPMSAGELRELAGDLPRASGSAAALPPVLLYMPTRGFVRNSQKYAEGPAVLAALAVPVSADQVDFGSSAEVTLGHYDTPSGDATLMLIYYTNPQVAIEHLRRLDPNYQPQSGVAAVGNVGSLRYKRTGPIIAIVSGAAAESDAKSLLSLVNYEAKVTWNEATDNHDVHDLYQLVLNVVILCAIVGGLAIVAGVAFGGFRIVMKRWFPDKVFDRPEQMEFISLRLTETVVEIPGQSGPHAERHAHKSHSERK